VAVLPGHEAVLAAAGFERRGQGFEWSWAKCAADEGPCAGSGTEASSSSSVQQQQQQQHKKSGGAIGRASSFSECKEHASCSGVNRSETSTVGEPGNEPRNEPGNGDEQQQTCGEAVEDEDPIPYDRKMAVRILKAEVKMLQCLIDNYGKEEVFQADHSSNSGDEGRSAAVGYWSAVVEKTMLDEVKSRSPLSSP
jgi:hypothetical protein